MLLPRRGATMSVVESRFRIGVISHRKFPSSMTEEIVSLEHFFISQVNLCSSRKRKRPHFPVPRDWTSFGDFREEGFERLNLEIRSPFRDTARSSRVINARTFA